MRFNIKSEKEKDFLKVLLLAAAGFLGLCILLKDSGHSRDMFWSIYSVFILAFLIIVEKDIVSLMRKDGDISKRIFKYAAVFGAFFGMATDAGYQFALTEMTAPGIKGKFFIFLTGILLSALFLPVTYRIFRFVEGLYSHGTEKEEKKFKPLMVFVISLVILQIFWLPAFLAYYPAIMSYDFHRQFGEAVKGYIWFFEYQPLSHTFLIRMAYLLGLKLGDLGKGMAILALFQSLILSSSISAGITYVYKKTGKKPALFWLVLFALLPFNPILAISMTKDIIFSAFFAVVILSVCNMKGGARRWVYVMFFICGIVNILFRNNASYAMVFLIPAFMLTEKGLKKKLILSAMVLVTVVSGLGCKTLIRKSMNAIPGSKMEMFSVPITQMTRVIKYQCGNLNVEQTQILQKYVTDFIWGVYNPYIADGPKGTIALYNEGAWINDYPTLLKDYLALGKAYPNDYIDAFLGITLGYWFIDDKSHCEVLDYGADTDMGLLYTFNVSFNEVVPDGIPSRSFLPGLEKKYSEIVNGNSYYDWPIVSFLMRPAFYMWLFILAVFAAVYKRSKYSFAVFAYPFFYFLTMLLGPTVNFRYVYPYIIALPVLIAFVLSEKKRTVPEAEETK